MSRRAIHSTPQIDKLVAQRDAIQAQIDKLRKKAEHKRYALAYPDKIAVIQRRTYLRRVGRTIEDWSFGD